MKTIGIVLLVIGSLAFLLGFNMDTSVATEFGGQRVHNIGLMNDRQSIVIFAGVLAVIGAIFTGLAGRIKLNPPADTFATARSCPFCAEAIKPQAILCRYCGRDVLPLAVETEKNPGSIDLDEAWKKFTSLFSFRSTHGK